MPENASRHETVMIEKNAIYRHKKSGQLYKISRIISAHQPLVDKWFVWIEYLSGVLPEVYYLKRQDKFLDSFEKQNDG